MSIDARDVKLQVAPTTSNTAIANGDTMEMVAGKAQGQINAVIAAVAAKPDAATTIINALIFG